MKNVEMTVEGTLLTIKVDLSKEFGPSSSGKTIIIASTEGNVTIPNREEKSRAQRVPQKGMRRKKIWPELILPQGIDTGHHGASHRASGGIRCQMERNVSALFRQVA